MESIYEKIRAAVQPDGALPDRFSVQPKPAPGTLHFADGARDGIGLYHTRVSPNEELLLQLERITSMAACGGELQQAGEMLDACFGESDEMLGCIGGLQKWIIGLQDALSAERVFRFAVSLLLESGSVGAVKYALSVLELLAGVPGSWRDCVRTLALSDEFTLYCVWIASHWENSSEELFSMAQKTRGWGRVHAVRELEPATQEMKDWLLDEGWDNDVLPAYTALRCAQAGGLRERLEGAPLSRKQLDAADGLIQGLLDEGPCRNISLMEDAEELLLAWLDQAEKTDANEEDRKTLKYLQEEAQQRDWPRLRARLGISD